MIELVFWLLPISFDHLIASNLIYKRYTPHPPPSLLLFQNELVHILLNQTRFFKKMFLSVFHFEFIRFIWNLYESTFMIFRWEGLNQKSSQRWMDERAKIAPKMFVPTSKARSYTQSRYNREWLSPISKIDFQFSGYMRQLRSVREKRLLIWIVSYFRDYRTFQWPCVSTVNQL